ncbi:MAG: glycine cleavage system protein H [Planctomycetota bacterium]|jgi:CheY-like chemotaxis protein/glycine cleavage system H lipoate-binding protein
MSERILVVDDEEVVLLSVKKAFRKMPYAVDTVQSATEALGLMADNPYNVVIADLMMPKVDGLELLRRINAEGYAVQTIMLTGYPTIRTALIAKRLGAFEYVTKPFTRDELQSVVVRALRSRAQPASTPEPSASPPAEPSAHAIPDHSWVRAEADGSVTVGMVAVFAATVGEIADLKLPDLEAELEQGRMCVTLRAVDGVAHTLHCPVSGRVTEINPALQEDLGLAGRAPEGAGWLLRLEPANLERELKNLSPL